MFKTFRIFYLSLVALLGLCGAVAIGNYAVTVGSGTNFGSVVVGGVHYAQQFICDLTTPSQCATVDASGILTVKGTVTATPTGTQAVSIAAGADVTTGNTTDAACAGDTTSGCTVESRLIRIAQNVTTLNTTASAPIPTQSSTVPIGGVSLCDGANGTTNPCTTAATVKAASTPAAATDKALVVAVSPNNNVGQLPYPSGSTAYTATATGTTGATTATLAGAASVTTYICGFSIRANATAAATGNATVTGVITATLNYTQWTAPNASGIGVVEQIYTPCIPASATNTSIAVVSAAPGTGGVVSVTAWGYKL